MAITTQLEHLAALQQTLNLADTKRHLASEFVRGCYQLLKIGQAATQGVELSTVLLFADAFDGATLALPLDKSAGKSVCGLGCFEGEIYWLDKGKDALLAADVVTDLLKQPATAYKRYHKQLAAHLEEHLLTPLGISKHVEVVHIAALNLPTVPVGALQYVETQGIAASDTSASNVTAKAMTANDKQLNIERSKVRQSDAAQDIPMGLLVVLQHPINSYVTTDTVHHAKAAKSVHLDDAEHALLKVVLTHMAHCLSVLQQRNQNTTNSLLTGNETIPDCYLGIDHEGHIQHLNQRAADMLGRPKEQLYGRALGDLLPHFRDALERALEHATSSDRPQCLDVQSPHNGSWQELYIQAVTSGFQLYSRDVSERKRVEAVLEQERGELHHLADFRRKLVEFVNRTLQIVPQDGWHQEFLECVLEVIPNAQAGSLVMPDLTREGRFYYVAAVGYELSDLQTISFSEADMQARAQQHPTVVRSWQQSYPQAFHKQRKKMVEVTGNTALVDQLAAITVSLCVPVFAIEPTRLEPASTVPTSSSSKISSTASTGSQLTVLSNTSTAEHLAQSPHKAPLNTAHNLNLHNLSTHSVSSRNLANRTQTTSRTTQPLAAMLFIDNFDDSNAFPPDVLELAQTVAAQMSILLQRFALEHTIRQNERRYRYVTDVIAEVVYVYRQNEDGLFVREWGNWHNELRLTGYTPDEIDAKGGWAGIIHPDDVHVHHLQKARVRQGEGGVSVYRIITKSGEERWIRDFCKSVRDEMGSVVVQYGANQDITEQKCAEQEREALLALTKQQRALAEAQLAELKELHAANRQVTADLRANEARYKRIAEENIQLLALEKEQRLSLEARIGELAMLNNLNRVVSRAVDLDSTLAIITEHVARLFQSTRCHVALLRDFDNALEVVAEYASHQAEDANNQDTDNHSPDNHSPDNHSPDNHSPDNQDINNHSASHQGDAASVKTKLGVVIDVTQNTAVGNAIHQGQAAIVEDVIAAFNDVADLPEASLEIVHPSAQPVLQPVLPPTSAVLADGENTQVPTSPTDTQMIAPLRARDNVFGMISVEADAVERPFNNQELSLLETVAGNVAGLISNAKLYSLQKEQFNTLKKLKAQLEHKNRELVYLSMRDPLTGLYNRRHFDRVLAQTFTTTQRRTREGLSVAVCDIDNFKKINDTFSHATGDDVLRAVATLMLSCMRAVDTVARYGGEEFAIILPQTGLDDAVAVCERIRSSIADYPWQDVQDALVVTISIGVCADIDVSHHEKMLNLADRNLYKAKHSGKNQVYY
jgi:diguanylate cyclase (GGDEF)-like protein/PAS domain S-box-containing protein